MVKGYYAVWNGDDRPGFPKIVFWSGYSWLCKKLYRSWNDEKGISDFNYFDNKEPLFESIDVLKSNDHLLTCKLQSQLDMAMECLEEVTNRFKYLSSKEVYTMLGETLDKLKQEKMNENKKNRL